MKQSLTPDQEAWLFNAKDVENQKAPKGQSCGNCTHCFYYQFTKRIHYCRISKSNHTENGFSKTKARAWCKDWKKEEKP